jgi:hypothetical protein
MTKASDEKPTQPSTGQPEPSPEAAKKLIEQLEQLMKEQFPGGVPSPQEDNKPS